MKKIFKEILDKAIPYYENSREGDIVHIKWLVKTTPRFIGETTVDFDILIPLIILHDVGYSKIQNKSDPFNLDIRKSHSEEGAEIAEIILKELKYPKDKINEIRRLILIHDNWAFGDSFSDEPILRIFNNFDFIWMASKKGFNTVRKFTNKKPSEFYKQIVKFQKKNEEEGRTWVNKRIEAFYNKLMKDRQEELSRKIN